MSNDLSYTLKLQSEQFARALASATGALGQFRGSVTDASGKVREFGRTGSEVGKVGSAFKGLLAPIAAVSAALGSLMAAKAGLSKALGNAAELESTTVAFETLTGSASVAAATLDKLRKFGAETPLEFPDIANAARMLIAFGESASTVTETLRRVGDISSGVGAGIGEIAEIYGKARVAGTLFAEDINQLLGRGIPVIKEFAKQLGVSEAEVKKLASEGKVTFPMLEQAFVALTSKGGVFFDMMSKQATTNKGLISTLKDNWDELFTTMGQPINDALKPVLQDAIGLVQQLQPMAAALGNAIAPAITGIRDFIASAGDGTNLVKAMGDQLWKTFAGLADLAMVPIQVMAAGLPALGSGFMAAITPVGEWLMITLEMTAKKFAAQIMSGVSLVADFLGEAFEQNPLTRSMGQRLRAGAAEAGTKANVLDIQAGRAAKLQDEAAKAILPGLEEAGKLASQAMADVKEAFSRTVEGIQDKLTGDTASKIVQSGRKSGRESVAPLEDPYEYVKKEGAIGRGEKRLRMREATLEEIAAGADPNKKVPVVSAQARAEWDAAEAERRKVKKPASSPAATATAQPAAEPEKKESKLVVPPPSIPVPPAPTLGRYDAEGRRADGRRKITGYSFQRGAGGNQDGGEGGEQTSTKARLSPRGFGQTWGQLSPPRINLAAPGTANRQQDRREAAAAASQGEKQRWDIVQKISEQLNKLVVA